MVQLLSWLMPLDKVAERLGVSIYTVRRLVASGALRSVHVGSRVMVLSDEVARAQKDGIGTSKRRSETAAQAEAGA